MDLALSKMTPQDIDLDELVRVICEAGRPLHINVLTRAAVRVWLERGPAERHYAPGARYSQGETIVFGGQSAVVKSARRGGNPCQGQFTVLTLVLSNGEELYIAAEVAGAPRQSVRAFPEEDVRMALTSKKGLPIRTAVQEAMSRDNRFAWFQDVQGDQWCLRELLPEVGHSELSKVAGVLVKELQNGEPVSKTTEELVRVVWGNEDDGSNGYAVQVFALGRVLSSCRDVESLSGRWIWTETWETFTKRRSLAGPRQSTGDGITADESQMSETESDEGLERTEGIDVGDDSSEVGTALEDIESWSADRLRYAPFTLSARHYYEGWLPLTKRVERLFPPLASGKQEITFHHHFGDEPGLFRAWVDLEQRRIWISSAMQETFRDHGIYPGARLRISHRTRREYDIATRPTTRTDPVRIWRMWLEDGEIQYSEDQEPRRYDIDDDVFLADVRFEDMEALFEQAEGVGKSIFRLMWDQAEQQLQAQGGNDPYVTVDDLFEAIHYSEHGRMTSKATVAWELWRRKAFKPAGGGRYLFQPEYGALMRRAIGYVGTGRSRTNARALSFQKTKSLVDLAIDAQDQELPEIQGGNRVLIRYVPKAGGRTSQVHFTREIAEEYFGFVLDQPRTIRLRQLRPGRPLGPVESRPLVYSISNRNCKIEVSGARRLGEHYPTDGQRPIIVFEEIEKDLFHYLPLLPSDGGFELLSEHLDSLPRGKALASDIIDLDTLLRIWPGYPVSNERRV